MHGAYLALELRLVRITIFDQDLGDDLRGVEPAPEDVVLAPFSPQEAAEVPERVPGDLSVRGLADIACVLRADASEADPVARVDAAHLLERQEHHVPELELIED